MKKSLAEKKHPLLPISIEVHYQDNPECPLLAGFFGYFAYETGGMEFPEGQNIEPVKSIRDFLDNMTGQNKQTLAVDLVDQNGDTTKCAFVIGRAQALEAFLGFVGSGWKVAALAHFAWVAERLKMWAANDPCYELRLVVNGDVVKSIGGFWEDDPDDALVLAKKYGLDMDAVAPTVWDVIPDKFQWSARLKRAMNDLTRHCTELDAIELQLSEFGYGIEDVPKLSELEILCEDIPGEPPIGTLAVNFVKAHHIAKSVLGTDWSLPDAELERIFKLRGHFWLSLEPSEEYDAPELPLPKIEYNWLSPDGFTISIDNFNTKKEADIFFCDWLNRFKQQGYYSSNNGRISLDDLPHLCQPMEIEVEPDDNDSFQESENVSTSF